MTESTRSTLFPSSDRCVRTCALQRRNRPITQHRDKLYLATGGALRHLCMLMLHHPCRGLMSEPPQCCICLDELTSPASLPCGHSFCLACIGEYWRIQVACQCPLCKAFYPTRPPLKTDQTQQEVEAPLKAGEVPCDFCPAEHRAVKSCVDCLASYCAAHLEPHYLREDLGRHLLIGVVKNLEESVCGLHGKQLSRFCRSDQTCICAMCVRTEHRGHHIISVNKEATKKKVRLKWRTVKVQQAIQERLSRVEKIKRALDLGGGSPKETWTQNQEVIRKLEEEISELQSRNAELEQLAQTEDDLHFLRVCVTTDRSFYFNKQDLKS